jgi:hypothetical protein
MPRIPSGSSSRSRSSSSKSNRSKKSKKNARKTVRRELKGKKLPVSQIERIIEFEKMSDATVPSIQHSPGEYVRMREILSKLRFDRDENLAKIITYLTAVSKATDATKREVGWM